MSMLSKIRKTAKGMLLDGIGASEHIDSSGEILDVKGCDISDVEDGVATINYEHKDDTPTDTIGRLVYAKKIFEKDDCDDERQLGYWKQSGVPFIYIIGELMDQDGHTGAADAAAIVRHYASRGLPILARWSIEGTTLDKPKGSNHLKQSIFKRVALTLKPCNKDATSGLLFDPKRPDAVDSKKEDIKSIVDKVDKYEHPSYTKLGGSIEVECMPLIEKSEDKAELTREMVKEAMKDWDGEEDVKKFIKHKMPEASDEFVDKFADLVDGFKMKVKKFEKLEQAMYKLSKALDQTPAKSEEPLDFNGAKVKPGSGTLYDAATKTRSPLTILGHDPETQSFLVVPQDKKAGWTEQDIKKLPAGHSGLRIEKYPENIEAPSVVNASTNGVNLTPDAVDLVHNLELDPKNTLSKKHLGTSTKAYWAKNAQGKTVFIKPDTDNEAFGDAAREGAYHNAAKEAFGLGNYLPTVGTVRHPKTGQLHSVIEAAPGEHSEQRTYGDELPKNQEHINTIKKLGDAGELDKMGIMDTIMGNEDRHHQNYLFTPEGSLKLIDHGGVFSPEKPMYDPDYLSKYQKVKEVEGGQKHETSPLHPATAQWLLSLDPKALRRSLRKSKVPLQTVNEAERRLVTMQQAIQANPGTSKFDTYNAPWGVRQAPEEVN